VINIPKEVTSLEEGASRKRMQQGSVGLRNSFGDVGYGGPQPPRGTGDHSYVMTLYALVEKLDSKTDASFSAFKKAIEGKTIAFASIMGKYRK